MHNGDSANTEDMDSMPEPQQDAPSQLSPEHQPDASTQHTPSALKALFDGHLTLRGPAAWTAVGLALMAGVGLIAVIVAARRGMMRREIEDAARSLGESTTITELSEVIQNHVSSDVAPLALMRLAEAQFNRGRYDDAKNTFGQFLSAYPTHSLLFCAHYGQIVCDEVLGQHNKPLLEKALKSYTDFSSLSPSSILMEEHKSEQKFIRDLLVLQAEFGRGRCLEQLDLLAEAKQLYEEMKVSPQTPDVWKARVDEAIERVETHISRRAGDL